MHDVLGRGPVGGQQVAERGVLPLAQRAVERRHGAGRVAQREQLVDRDLGLGGDLVVGRRAVELERQRVLRARDLALRAHEVDRQLDRAGLGVHPALDGLADPPRRVGREAVAAAPVELLDGADQAEDALLDQVEQRQLGALVLLGDRDDQAQVRVDHALLGGEVAALDALGELDLLARRQQPVAADLVEEELQRVGGDGRSAASSTGAAIASSRPQSSRRSIPRAGAARRGAPRSASSSSSAWASSSTSHRSRQPSSSPRSNRAAIGPPDSVAGHVITVNASPERRSDETYGCGRLAAVVGHIASTGTRLVHDTQGRKTDVRAIQANEPAERSATGPQRPPSEPRTNGRTAVGRAPADGSHRRDGRDRPRRDDRTRDEAATTRAEDRAATADRACATARRDRRRAPEPDAVATRDTCATPARASARSSAASTGAPRSSAGSSPSASARCSSAILAAAGAAVGLTAERHAVGRHAERRDDRRSAARIAAARRADDRLLLRRLRRRADVALRRRPPGLRRLAVRHRRDVVLALAAVILGSEYNVLEQLNLPSLPVGDATLTTGGAIALAAVVLGSLLAADRRRQGRRALPPQGRSRRLHRLGRHDFTRPAR